ncbi:hypothetical protein CW745_04345 [Psychromonas sp. psych-6C06]|uniref:hypothetical protein n=1 Tax=Psychromonas sp. psych-6C06 TaxID=2058089 RepID=UPI000C32308A|nr:hypothetical protein [Psychromonas sp. psych-6C06]PKF62659.1 hypothetical protein CW745_04345 [Psychromonas sp. psych-6C06]
MTKEVPLRLGEKVMPKAPLVQLNNGQYCIPQHYLTYHHTLDSVESLICDIEYDPRYVVFVANSGEDIYLQVGVVGHDNYHKGADLNKLKLLFGRKWRVEPELSTSEVIQTVFLAIKKSREHEVRELFKLSMNDSITTPFNTHIDLPLMAEYYKEKQNLPDTALQVDEAEHVKRVLKAIDYDNCQLFLHCLEQRANGLWLVDIDVIQSEQSSLDELAGVRLYLQVSDLSVNALSRALMDEFIRLSDAHVDKHFSYRGFHRFDPAIDIVDIADLSQQTRKHELSAHFSDEFKKSNYEVDQRRIPPVKQGALAEKHSAILKQFNLKPSQSIDKHE